MKVIPGSYALNLISTFVSYKPVRCSGADPGFQVRGGGALKKKCAERREAL